MRYKVQDGNEASALAAIHVHGFPSRPAGLFAFDFRPLPEASGVERLEPNIYSAMAELQRLGLAGGSNWRVSTTNADFSVSRSYALAGNRNRAAPGNAPGPNFFSPLSCAAARSVAAGTRARFCPSSSPTTTPCARRLAREQTAACRLSAGGRSALARS